MAEAGHVFDVWIATLSVSGSLVPWGWCRSAAEPARKGSVCSVAREAFDNGLAAQLVGNGVRLAAIRPASPVTINLFNSV